MFQWTDIVLLLLLIYFSVGFLLSSSLESTQRFFRSSSPRVSFFWAVVVVFVSFVACTSFHIWKSLKTNANTIIFLCNVVEKRGGNNRQQKSAIASKWEKERKLKALPIRFDTLKQLHFFLFECAYLQVFEWWECDKLNLKKWW